MQPLRGRRDVALTGMLALVTGMALVGVVAAAPAPPPGVQLPPSVPTVEAPALVTTLGQSPGALMIKLLCDGSGIACTEGPLVTAKELKAAVEAQKPAYRTLIVTMGTSLKGMGAAGIDIDFEVKRVTDLIEAARALGLTIIGAQIEGPSRRVDEYDEKSIRTVTPLSDILIVRKDVNQDGYFTKVAGEKQLPIVFITQPMETEYVLKVLFGKI